MTINRRRIIQAGAFALAGGEFAGRALAASTWNGGDLVHLIPAANHERFLIKCSFGAPRNVPRLRIGTGLVAGIVTDSEGRYFSYDVPNLRPNTSYELQLVDDKGEGICDAWSLSTFPDPDAQPARVRLLAFTCAGGYPNYPYPAESQPFLPLAIRRRLLARALSFAPDAMVAIGDHVYWDQRTQLDAADADARARAAAWYDSVGALDRSLPAKGTRNEVALKKAVEPQIAELYGVMLRSTPSYFVNDDHDYFENDEATDRFVTLPPHAYQLSFARFVRELFLPGFLPDPARPALMSGAWDRPDAVAESFGTFRYGNLVEGLIYDCARFLSLKGDVAGLVAPEAERWILDRTAAQEVRHLLHVPSHPFGWTAGKWREWYPDVADVGEGDTAVAQIRAAGQRQFRLTTARRKFMWQRGWFLQHQRLLAGLAGQRFREGVVLSGDLHATGHARIVRSADLDLSSNPVHTILTGPIGTKRGWPSAARGTAPLIATDLDAEDLTPVSERNGFTLLDMTQDEIEVRLFAWRHEPEAAIDSLEPYHRFTISRRD